MLPFAKIEQWLAKEVESGSTNPKYGVLATADKHAIPHCRIVAIREINPNQGILFFTQRNSRKVLEIYQNPVAAMTIWLAQLQRQINLEGKIIPLTSAENSKYWQGLSQERQLRFLAYAPISGQRISALTDLTERHDRLMSEYQSRDIPCPEDYLGFFLQPQSIIFYTLGTINFSEVIHYYLENNAWQSELISP